MRIALILTSFPEKSSDEPVFPATWFLAKSLRDNGHEVLVLTSMAKSGSNEATDLSDLDGIKVFRSRYDPAKYQAFMGLAGFGQFSHFVAIARDLFEAGEQVLTDFNPDVIECQEFNGIGFFFAAQHKYPLVIRCYGAFSILIRMGDVGPRALADTEMVEALEMMPVAAADCAISICHDLAKRLSGPSCRPADTFDIVRLPFVAPPESPTKAGFVLKGPKIFFWGRVERQKGADLLVECLPRIIEQYPNAHMIIGGSDRIEHGHDRPYSHIMRERLNELNLLDKVTFTGLLTRAEIHKNIIDSDICVFPSRYETACYALLEAQSCGACCVATKVGGLVEYQIDNETVCLVEPNDPQALADGILKLAGDQALREKLANQGRANVFKICDPQLNMDQSLVVYQKAIDIFKEKSASQSKAFEVLGAHLGVALANKSSIELLWESAQGQEPLAAAYAAGYADAKKLFEQPEPLPVVLRKLGSSIKYKLLK